jgi:hypothetical protein
MGERNTGSSQFIPIKPGSSAHGLAADWGLSAAGHGHCVPWTAVCLAGAHENDDDICEAAYKPRNVGGGYLLSTLAYDSHGALAAPWSKWALRKMRCQSASW